MGLALYFYWTALLYRKWLPNCFCVKIIRLCRQIYRKIYYLFWILWHLWIFQLFKNLYFVVIFFILNKHFPSHYLCVSTSVFFFLKKHPTVEASCRTPPRAALGVRRHALQTGWIVLYCFQFASQEIDHMNTYQSLGHGRILWGTQINRLHQTKVETSVLILNIVRGRIKEQRKPFRWFCLLVFWNFYFFIYFKRTKVMAITSMAVNLVIANKITNAYAFWVEVLFINFYWGIICIKKSKHIIRIDYATLNIVLSSFIYSEQTII